MWAITSSGIGRTVTARSVMPDWPLLDGEAFKVVHWEPGMVLAEDGASIRHATEVEISGESITERIDALQAAYEIDRDKLNRAWLSAMIADGVEETTRKSAIESQMTALDAQLEADILAVLTGE